MNTRMQADTWIFHTVLVLGLILVASVVGILIQMITGRPLPEILVALGLVAAGGLIRLVISPLTPRLME